MDNNRDFGRERWNFGYQPARRNDVEERGYQPSKPRGGSDSDKPSTPPRGGSSVQNK